MVDKLNVAIDCIGNVHAKIAVQWGGSKDAVSGGWRRKVMRMQTNKHNKTGFWFGLRFFSRRTNEKLLENFLIALVLRKRENVI